MVLRYTCPRQRKTPVMLRIIETYRKSALQRRVSFDIDFLGCLKGYIDHAMEFDTQGYEVVFIEGITFVDGILSA